MDDKLLSNLSDKIWITRKCRINTSERLIFLNYISQFFINYYTLVILSISIYTLYSDNASDFLSFTTVIASLFLFAVTIGINTLDYKGRIRDLKNCYIELDVLINKLELLKRELQLKETREIKLQFEQIRDDYIKNLKGVENHNSYDYLKFKLSQKEYRNVFLYLKYYAVNILFILTIVLLMFLPFLPILLMYKDWI
ncbi:SLATT domain-containing protein [Metabacillus sp. HB246100]